MSLFDAAVSSLANQGSNYLNTGYTPGLNGSLHPNIAPYGETFRTKDGKYITLAIGTDNQFMELCACLNIPELSKNNLFRSNPERVKNRKKLSEKIQRAILKFNAENISAGLLQCKIPFGFIKNLHEVFGQKTAKKLILKGTKGYKTIKSVIFS